MRPTGYRCRNIASMRVIQLTRTMPITQRKVASSFCSTRSVRSFTVLEGRHSAVERAEPLVDLLVHALKTSHSDRKRVHGYAL